MENEMNNSIILGCSVIANLDVDGVSLTQEWDWGLDIDEVNITIKDLVRLVKFAKELGLVKEEDLK
jgi:hypothetical protein